MRIMPPPAGHLYYRAFVPDEQYRDRSRRMAQPWELTLRLVGGSVTGTLTRLEQVWKESQVWPDLKVADFGVATPQELRPKMDKEGPGIPVMLVFADDAMSYGQLMTFLSPVMSDHPTIHVYLNPKP